MIGFYGEGVRGMKQRRRIFTSTLLGLAVFAIAAPAALGHPFIDRSTSSVSPQIRALQLRSEGMNQQYGTATAIRALQLRSEALNKANGLGVYQGTDALSIRHRRREAVALGEEPRRPVGERAGARLVGGRRGRDRAGVVEDDGCLDLGRNLGEVGERLLRVHGR